MKIGILAGGGQFPPRLAAHCRENNIAYHLFVLGDYEGSLEGEPYSLHRIGAAGSIVKGCVREGVTDIVMVGRVPRPTFAELRPDWFTLRQLPAVGLASKGDDGMLKSVLNIFEKHTGARVRGIHEFMPELLAADGVWGQVAPTESDMAITIPLGIKAALEHGMQDRGQAVIVAGERIAAVEGRAGTDALMREFFANGGKDGILVKLCKPQQDERIDLPTVGVQTVQTAVACGIRGIVVSTGRTLVDRKDEMLALANKAGIFVMGVKAP